MPICKPVSGTYHQLCLNVECADSVCSAVLSSEECCAQRSQGRLGIFIRVGKTQIVGFIEVLTVKNFDHNTGRVTDLNAYGFSIVIISFQCFDAVCWAVMATCL